MRRKLPGAVVALSLALLLLAGCGKAAPRQYAVGVVDDKGYHSDYYGIQFALPPGVTMVDTQTMQEGTRREQQELGGDSELLDQARATVTYEMVAIQPDVGANLIVLTEPLRRPVTVEQYTEGVKTQLDSFGDMAPTYLGEPEEVTLAGKPFTRIVYTNPIPGMELVAYQEFYFLLEPERVLCMTLGCVDTPESRAGGTAMLAAFTGL